MPTYKNKDTGEIKDIPSDRMEEWLANSNPKADKWEPYTPPEPEETPPQVPWAISNADLRRQLSRAGLNPALVLEFLKGLEEGPAKWEAISDWEYANYFERNHPMFESLAPQFGFDSKLVDAMFLACQPYPRLY